MSYPQGQYPDPNQQQPWGSPQQGSGYGNQGYPQSGGGYYGGQDPYGQQPGYQQQPGGYPPTSGSPYGQPAQPQYPGYGDQQAYPPQSGGGAYGQPAPYGQPQDPGWGYGAPVPTPPQKSRAPLIVGVIVLAVLVLGGAAATVFFVTKGNSTTTAGPSSGPTTTSSRGATSGPTGGATTGAPKTATVTFAAPDKIGNYKKAADDATANQMKTQMEAAGLSDPYTAVYEDTSGQRVVIWGGAGSIFSGSPDTQLNAFFTSAAKSLNGTLGPKVAADSGSLGGKAQCSKVSGTGANLSLCAWSGSNALLGFIFTAIAPEKAATNVKTILPAVVVKS